MLNNIYNLIQLTESRVSLIDDLIHAANSKHPVLKGFTQGINPLHWNRNYDVSDIVKQIEYQTASDKNLHNLNMAVAGRSAGFGTLATGTYQGSKKLKQLYDDSK